MSNKVLKITFVSRKGWCRLRCGGSLPSLLRFRSHKFLKFSHHLHHLPLHIISSIRSLFDFFRLFGDFGRSTNGFSKRRISSLATHGDFESEKETAKLKSFQRSGGASARTRFPEKISVSEEHFRAELPFLEEKIEELQTYQSLRIRLENQLYDHASRKHVLPAFFSCLLSAINKEES